MSRFSHGLFCVGKIALILLSLLSLSANFTSAQVNINGPQPIPASTGGILVPNPYMGDRIIWPGNEKVTIGAQVGDFTINISGLASPNASVVLTSDGQFLRSTVADNDGYFHISQLTVRSGFSSFCLDSIDFERLGESQGCMKFQPLTTSYEFKNVYIPPTIGLFAKEINAGQEALIYGYSMPGAEVDVNLSDGQVFQLTADAEGYYEYRYPNVPAGTYNLASVGDFQGIKSLEPTKDQELKVLSVPEQITSTATNTLDDIGQTVTTSIFGFFLLLLLLLLIIGIILLIILKPWWLREIFDRFNKKIPLHHDWLLDFEDKILVKP